MENIDGYKYKIRELEVMGQVTQEWEQGMCKMHHG